MEIGGYIELDNYHGGMYHDDLIALNCGRNCLAYLLEAKQIKKIALPAFLCETVKNAVKRYPDIRIREYHVGKDLRPQLAENSLEDDEWLYLVNYYGQFDNEEIFQFHKKAKGKLIADNAQAFFQEPVKGVDTIYTCRKFFGVPDGAFLSTDVKLERDYPADKSYDRMHYLLGRYEGAASEFYGEYVSNNDRFMTEPIKQMSKLTDNLLRGIDYEMVRQRRTENFAYLHNKLCEINKLKVRNVKGAFMYPLYIENGADIRKQLLQNNIYIPTLWPNVIEEQKEWMTESDLARNILPLPVDQRYEEEEMEFLINRIMKGIE